MKLQDIEAIQKNFLTPADVAPYLCADPQTIRIQARQRPDLLGFPVNIVGSRVKIPKDLFVQHFRGNLASRA